MREGQGLQLATEHEICGRLPGILPVSSFLAGPLVSFGYPKRTSADKRRGVGRSRSSDLPNTVQRSAEKVTFQ